MDFESVYCRFGEGIDTHIFFSVCFLFCVVTDKIRKLDLI